MKRLLSIMMCLVLVCSLVACGNSSSSTGSTSSTEAQTSSSTDAATAEDTTVKREEPVKLVLCFMNWVGAMENQQKVAAAMNEITLEKLNIEVELEIMDSASYSQQMTLKLAGGEQVDMFNAISLGYSTAINNGYVVDLEENNLIQNYGQGILETLEQKYIDACRFGGVLYGLPNQRDMAIGLNAYAIGSQYLDAIGYEYTDENVIKVSQEEIDDVLGKIHAQFPELTTIAPQTATLGQSNLYDALSGDNYGVLLDPENSLEVSDLFSSDLYMNYCQKWYDYKQAGYISGDALTNDVAATTQVRAGTAMAYQTATKPGIKAQESNLCAQNMVILQAGGDFLKSNSVSGMPWCIAVNTVDEVASMQYLNELYTNPELSKLLCWGVEGQEWQYSEDGHITFAEGVTADTSGYLHNVNWQLPNQFIAGVFEGDSLDLWDQMETFNNEAIASKALGFMFDNTAVSTEFTALANIYSEYQKQLEFGFSDPKTTIPEMLQRMKDAGLDKYIEAKSAALVEWASVNGVS